MKSSSGPDRIAHVTREDLVVFHIGMKIRQPWRVDQWGPVAAAMPRMLAELSRDPDSGLLGYKLIMDPRGPWTVQYWESTEKLYAYASDRDSAHRPAWAAFNKRARQHPDAVGVWHETFEVSRSESIYVGVPPIGLGALGWAPVGPSSDTAAQRITRGSGSTPRS